MTIFHKQIDPDLDQLQHFDSDLIFFHFSLIDVYSNAARVSACYDAIISRIFCGIEFLVADC